MLKALRRLERTRNIVILLFAILMAVSLVIFYAPGRNSSSIDPSKNTEVVAKVGSRPVPVRDVARVRDNYTRMFGSRVNLAHLGGNKRCLDGLMGRHVIAQGAERLGLGASDAELADKIKKRYADASGNFVGFDRYKEIVVSQYGDIESFENEIRDGIAQGELRAF